MTEAGGWSARLRAGLARSSAALAGGLGRVLGQPGGADKQALLDGVEDALIAADLGPAAAARLRGWLAEQPLGPILRGDAADADARLRRMLAEEIARILTPMARPLAPDAASHPHVIVVAGVNGSGKTTTIGKLAHHFRREGLRVMLVAGDTFRAAAVEQLRVWAERTDSAFAASAPGSDPAALVHDALEEARAADTDVVLVDTAGRLHTRDDLMAEMEKIIRVAGRRVPGAPHDVLLVLDGTSGQNARAQVAQFGAALNITGLAVTKLDGAARGGVVVALAQDGGPPIRAVGVGEGVEDLQPFDPAAFARDLLGLPADGGAD